MFARITARSKLILICSLILVAALGVGRVRVQGSDRSSGTTILGSNRPSAPRAHLDVTFSGQTLIGTATLSGKDALMQPGRQAWIHLLDASGRQIDTVPLQPVSPGEYRMIMPIDRLEGQGYLELDLAESEGSSKRGDVYQIDPVRRLVAWVEHGPDRAQASETQGIGQLATGGPDDFGYTWSDTAPFEWKDTAGGTPISLRDDDWVGPFSVGFGFTFYGQTYTQFYVDSNGYIGFDSTQVESVYANAPMGRAGRPNNLIAPFWDDLDPSQGGQVRYLTSGSTPNRFLVVEWNSVPLWGTSNYQTFQVVLYENGNVRFQYPNTRQGTGGDLRYATAGIENADGSIGLEYPQLIPVGENRAVQFIPNQPNHNAFLVPERQGTSAAAGEAATFRVRVRNLGKMSDSFVLSRPAYDGANWSTLFLQQDGVTPLPGNNTGTIPPGGEKTVVAKVQVPSGVALTAWTRSTIRATSQGNPGESHSSPLDVTIGSSLYQVYTDDYSEDGTEDSENYIEAIDRGRRCVRRLTTDQDNSSYAGVATTPNNRAVAMWNTSYYNGMAPVSEIQYAVLDSRCSIVHPVTRLTDNSGAWTTTWDFSPAVAVAPNGTVAIGWARQPNTYNVWYTLVQEDGSPIKPPTALTNNMANFPRDYPPSVAALTGGRFILTWEHAASSGSAVDIYVAVLGSGGNVIVNPRPLTDGSSLNVMPRIAAMPNGQAAIVWSAYNTSGYPDIHYATVNSEGTVTGGPVAITDNGNSGQRSSYADISALSDGRLGVAWTQQSGNDLQVQYTIVPGSPRRGIYGRVTYQGTPVAGIHLALRFYNGSSWSTALTTVTGTDGSYRFDGAPSLSSGQRYYVRYANGEDGNADDPRYLFVWQSYGIESYTAGASAPGGDFDIANIQLVSPLPGAQVSLPQTFQWTRRSATTTDSYELNLFDPVDSDPWWWTDPPLGYVGSYTLTSLPPGMSTGTGYGWNVWVYSPDGGTGISYYFRWVTFTTSTGATADGLEERYRDPDRLLEDRRLNRGTPAPAPHQSPVSALALHTVPNDVGNANVYVSLTTDQADRLIMTWLDDDVGRYLLYALADKNGTILTPATVLRRTQNSYLWSSWNGYGNDRLAPGAAPSPYITYVPVKLRDYRPSGPLPSPVTNGGFEAGSFTGWTVGSDAPSLTPQIVTTRRHGGQYAAVLGQENAPCESGKGGQAGRSWIYQDIEVPGSGAAQLVMYYRILTYDKLNADKYDRFEVYVDGTLLGRFGDTSPDYGCSQPISDLGWEQFTYDLQAYRGRTIRLRLVNVAYPDDWFGTWTYVDDIDVIQ